MFTREDDIIWGATRPHPNTVRETGWSRWMTTRGSLPVRELSPDLTTPPTSPPAHDVTDFLLNPLNFPIPLPPLQSRQLPAPTPIRASQQPVSVLDIYPNLRRDVIDLTMESDEDSVVLMSDDETWTL